jgi:cysteine desulfurase
VLYVNRRTRFNPFLIGGSQEQKRRGGTHNTASIVALGKAAELAAEYLPEESNRVKHLRDQFEQEVSTRISGVQLNGDREHRLPNTANIAIDGADSEGLLMLLDQKGVCCSAGSACTAGSLEPSHVLKAMGFSTERARASLRFSFGRFNTKEDVSSAAGILATAVERVRSANRVAVGG